MSAIDGTTAKLNIRPGIDKNTTELDSEGTYVSSDKIRFFYGKPEKIGGWQEEIVVGEIKGVARDVHTWVDLEERKYLGIGTNEKLYTFSNGALSDITPIDTSASADDVLNVTSGSDTITVSLPTTGVRENDYFVFAEVTASMASILFTSTYQITSVEPGHFTFTASTSADATVANFGGPTKVDYLLRTGRESNGSGFGWGAGTWGTKGVSATGSAGWSKPRVGTSVNLRQWSLDNWGEDLFACPRGGKIYRWEASAGVDQRAFLMASAAPSIVNDMLIAQEGRHVVALGTHTITGDFDPMLVRWSDSEDFADWTASAGNQAGEFRLENGSFIIGSQESRREVLVFTDESLYTMQRVGGDAVFSFSDLGRSNGLISQHGSVDIDGVSYWMGFSSFQVYDGVIRTLPCTVQKFLFDSDSVGSINQGQKEKIFCASNREFNEIWWFYPSKGVSENNRYVVFNYLEETWYVGLLNRTVWHDVDIFARPYAIDENGVLFIHEQGKDDGTAGLKAELVTSYFDLEDGDNLMFVDRLIPDNTVNKELSYTFNYKKYPQSSKVFTKGPYVTTPSTTKIQPRIRGRQMQIKYSTSVQGGGFRIGTDRLTMKPDGER